MSSSEENISYSLPEDKMDALRVINLSLHEAIKLNDLETMKDLLKKTSEKKFRNINEANETPLIYSLENNCSDDIVSYLIDIGGNVNAFEVCKYTPLHYAARRDTSFITEKLLKRGAKINVASSILSTPLDDALLSGKEENIWCLLNFITANNIKFSYKNVLCNAVYHCSASVIEELVKRGADINFPRSEWEALLNTAIREANDRPEIVHLLLYYNASVNEYNEQGCSIFFSAFRNDKSDQFLPYLIEYVDNFDRVTVHGETLLSEAIKYNSKYVPILIIEKRVNVNLLFVSRHKYVFEWKWPRSFDDFKLIWSHLNQKLLLKNQFTSILKELAFFCPSHMFLDCLCLIFDSPHAKKFVEEYLEYKPNGTKSFIYTLIERELAPEDKKTIFYLLMSHGADIQFQDIQAVYTRHGFDESLELILTIGSAINYDECKQFCKSKSTPVYEEPYMDISEEFSMAMFEEMAGYCISEEELFMARQICYNSLDFDKYYGHKERICSVPLCYQHARRVFCKNCLNYENRTLYHTKYYMNDLDEIPSLLQMCRDLIRLIMYKKWFTPHAFKVYQAFVQLPVPTKIKNILFLKDPIY